MKVKNAGASKLRPYIFGVKFPLAIPFHSGLKSKKMQFREAAFDSTDLGCSVCKNFQKMLILRVHTQYLYCTIFPFLATLQK